MTISYDNSVASISSCTFIENNTYQFYVFCERRDCIRCFVRRFKTKETPDKGSYPLSGGTFILLDDEIEQK